MDTSTEGTGETVEGGEGGEAVGSERGEEEVGGGEDGK